MDPGLLALLVYRSDFGNTISTDIRSLGRLKTLNPRQYDFNRAEFVANVLGVDDGVVV